MSDLAKKLPTAKVHWGIDKRTGEPVFWRVKIEEGRHIVRINGAVEDAVKGKPGVTIGCHLSNCAKRNARAFPHPCLMASFTKSRVIVVTRIKNGVPTHGVRYVHEYSDLVELNDTDFEKEYVKKHPELVERQFTLYPPGPRKKRGESGNHDHDDGSKKSSTPRGALARAIDAGLVPQYISEFVE